LHISYSSLSVGSSLDTGLVEEQDESGTAYYLYEAICSPHSFTSVCY